MNGGLSAIDAVGGGAEDMSRPTSGSVTNVAGVVVIPEGSLTAAWAALCVCLLQGCGTARSVAAANARNAVRATSSASVRTTNRFRLIGRPPTWRQCSTEPDGPNQCRV